jgi:2-polyprenyl-3-methyl-5-hydroxy-6-metoxy-1,4-benzoquinol methylase
MDLYEHIAGDYDAVTGAAGRNQAAQAMLAQLRLRHPFDRVLDVACGNGMHAMMLARMGVSVTAADISEAMLDQARRRAADAGLAVKWVHAPMQDIAKNVEGPFDAILCLGNSLPHLLDAHQLTRALAGFAKLLAPSGVVVLQLLNYARVLARQERIVGVTRQGDTEYVRFYDFLEDFVRFNVLKLTWSPGGCTHDLADTLLRPYTRDEIAAACRTAGLDRIDCHTGPAFADFDEQTSDTLTVIASIGHGEPLL